MSEDTWSYNYHKDLQAIEYRLKDLEYRLKELTQVLMEIASKVG